MEHVDWTDDLIDERVTAIDKSFDRRLEEMRSGFSELRAEMAVLRQRVDAGFSEQHREMFAFQRQMLFIVAGFVLALIGPLGAAVAQV